MPRQPYHLVEYSPWPLTAASGAMMLTSGLTMWFHNFGISVLIFGLTVLGMTMLFWWRDVIRESMILGFHTSFVTKGLKTGMILFIASEILFFFAFFWAFFQSSLAPCIELGAIWPPTGITPLNPFSIPLLNTTVLLASGISVTWAHHALLNLDNKMMLFALTITITLGVYFTFLQASEYIESSFTLSDSIYGSSFFIATGFHGLHVLIGSIFLSIALWRGLLTHFTPTHHLGFELAAWYWHFVDVVWIFLYLSIYWWGA